MRGRLRSPPTVGRIILLLPYQRKNCLWTPLHPRLRSGLKTIPHRELERELKDTLQNAMEIRVTSTPKHGFKLCGY